MNHLETRIMNRVGRIYILKQVITPMTLKLAALTVCVVAAASLVSVANVVANLSSVGSPEALVRFFSSAFLNTELTVKLLALAVVGTSLLILGDLLRGSAASFARS